MRPGTPGSPAGTPPALPSPAGRGTSARGEEAGQPPVYVRPATQARDCTPSPAASEPQVRQGRGKRTQEHVEAVNRYGLAADPVKALKESVRALTSVITYSVRQDPEAGAAWAWTAIHLIDGLCMLAEHARPPHPWFTDPAHHRLDPAGWAPPAALAQTAARIAGRRPRNGENK
jgi:hypothetical protein